MSFMRLGTRVAVINDENEILLSKRGDFGTWALPGGRVDSGELIQDCAVREVYEETGLKVVIERAVGLYYQQGRSRTDVLYRAKPVGGELFSKTDETLENRFFAPDNLPEIPFGKFYIDHAYTDKTYLHTIETPPLELLKLDLQLRWRWLKNLLSGRPEPKFPEFQIFVVGLIVDSSRQRVYALEDGQLPRVKLMGHYRIGMKLEYIVSLNDWQWVGIWQDVRSDTIELIFMLVQDMTSNMWIAARDLKMKRDKQYMDKVKPKHRQTVWFLEGEI